MLKPGGALAVWTHDLPQITLPVDAVIMKLYEDLVGPYWLPECYLVEAGYRTIPFPFEEIQPLAYAIELPWSLDDLLGYLGTWSATRRFMNVHGANPVDQIAEELTGAWGDPAEKKPTHWQLYLRVGRVGDHAR